MKRIKIYKRSILERTGFKKWPYKEVEEISIFHDKCEYSNHSQKINNPRLKVPFIKVFDTRKRKDVEIFISRLGRSESDSFLKEKLKFILDILDGGSDHVKNIN